MPASSPALTPNSSASQPPRPAPQLLVLEASLLGPLPLHPPHHLGPVLGVGPAGAGVHGDERVALVIATGEQPLLLECRQARLDRRELVVELGGELRVVLGH